MIEEPNLEALREHHPAKIYSSICKTKDINKLTMLGSKYFPTVTSGNGWFITVAGKTCPQKSYNPKIFSLKFKNLRLELNKIIHFCKHTGKHEAILAIWVSSSSYDIEDVSGCILGKFSTQIKQEYLYIHYYNKKNFIPMLQILIACHSS